MPVLYEPFQSILKNKEGKKLFYPRVVRTGNVNMTKIAKEIAAYSSLSPGDAKNTLDNLVTVMTQHLQSSESVTLDGLGTFRITMKSTGRGVASAEDVTAAQASLTVRFQPAYTRNVDHSMATRSMVTGVNCLRFDRAKKTASGSEEKPAPNPDEGGDDNGEAPDPTV